MMTRRRLRELGWSIGTLPPGPTNTITDVMGVSVGHCTVVHDAPRVARTGVTVVQPRPAGERDQLCYGALHSLNGNGEMTGSHWLAESGLLSGPVAITNTNQVGIVRDTLVADEHDSDPDALWSLPVVGETWDGVLNDIDAFHLNAEHVRAALADAERSGGHPAAVAEGNVGGGTGMICHEFKGGIGTSSRVTRCASGEFTVGALVQANYGRRDQLRLDGVPVGALIGPATTPLPDDPNAGDGGSIIVVLATDAPLLADQCRRLAQRATIGLARAGGFGSNSSGDIFCAFSTGNRVPRDADSPLTVSTLPPDHLTPLFLAAAEAVEEAIWNALCMAETMTGHRGRTVHAIPLEVLAELRTVRPTTGPPP
jgi:D-aminopeptidase